MEGIKLTLREESYWVRDMEGTVLCRILDSRGGIWLEGEWEPYEGVFDALHGSGNWAEYDQITKEEAEALMADPEKISPHYR